MLSTNMGPSCSLQDPGPLPADMVNVMAYVPYQNDDNLYSSDHGFVIGTMFPVLNKPFKGCGDKK